MKEKPRLLRCILFIVEKFFLAFDFRQLIKQWWGKCGRIFIPELA
jgi:hypothetical protein